MDRSIFDSRISFLSLFIAKYRIPWIFKWNYVIDSKEVHRQHFTKWWDKFNYEKTIEFILSEFPIAPTPAVAVQPTLPAVQSSSTQALPEIPKDTHSLLDISLSSSAKGKSTKSSSSKKKGKSSHLTHLAKQLIEELRKAEEREANNSDSDSSDASSQPPALWGDFSPDSQDPNDF